MGRHTMHKLAHTLQLSTYALTEFSGQGNSAQGFTSAQVTIGAPSTQKCFHVIAMDIQTILSMTFETKLIYLIDPYTNHIRCKNSSAIVPCHTVKDT